MHPPRSRTLLRPLLLILLLALAGCGPSAGAAAVPPGPPTGTAVPKAQAAVLARALAADEAAPTAVPSAPPAPTRTPPPAATNTAVPPTPSRTPTSTPTPGPCSARLPADALDTVVTLNYGLSKAYAPADLVALSDVLPREVTLGYPTEVRQEVLGPLVALIEAMQAEGLRPWIQSGYRSYIAQALAWEKWNRLYPETAAIVSAPPGHSEHQLGTVVDFGSPELAGLVGQPGIEFHTYFEQTSEGQWLAAHAHEYGFTMSYTRDSFDVSGFYYEPWHFRYVGPELAAALREQNLTYNEYLLADGTTPCLPD